MILNIFTVAAVINIYKTHKCSMKRFLSIRLSTLSRLKDLCTSVHIYASKWAYLHADLKVIQKKKEGSRVTMVGVGVSACESIGDMP